MNQYSDLKEASLNQLIDIYDVWYKPWWNSKSFYICTTLIILILICVLSYFLWKKYIQPKKFSYEKIAILQLQKLHKKSYESDESIRDAYFQMTMIMKTYLSKRYKIKLINKTDNEIIESIKSIVPSQIFITLQELFQRAYQIKFAYAAISLKMLYDDIDYMQRIIYETIKQNNDVGGS